MTNIVNYANPTAASKFNTGCDQIWFWDSNPAVNTWRKFGCRAVTKTAKQWQKYTGSDWAPITADDVVKTGDTVLFYNAAKSASVTLTLAGGVRPFADLKEYTIAAGKQQFIAYPWPVAVPVSTVVNSFSTKTGSSNFNTGCDQLWRWDATPSVNTWVKYGYRMVTKKEGRWERTSGGTWVGSALDDTVDIIPAGQGFLFYNAGKSANVANFTWSN